MTRDHIMHAKGGHANWSYIVADPGKRDMLVGMRMTHIWVVC